MPTFLRLLLLSLTALSLGCSASAPSAGTRRQAVKYSGHPVVERVGFLLERQAPRSECESWLRENDGTPVRVRTRREVLAQRPPLPPTQRAWSLLERWRKATYAAVIDDRRLLLYFDARERLVAYEDF